MATKLGKIIADFTTSLATAGAIGATTLTLQSATDDDNVSLPAGTYYFTLDGDNAQKEHIQCTLSGTALSAIYSVSRQGALTSGLARAHRVGASVKITTFAHIKYINDLLDGTTNLNASTPLGYDGTASITNANQIATKAYVDGVAVAGAPNASSTVKGIVEEATQAETDARTATGGTAAELYVNPTTLRATKYADPLASTGSANAYVLTIAPAITAYSTGQTFSFIANFASTGACTLNVSGLGAKSLKVYGLDPQSGYIATGTVVTAIYDGTNMQITSVSALPHISQDGREIYAADSVGTDSYAVTLSPVPTAYATGMTIRFKAGTANTGACTLNVNTLGAKTIKRNVSTDLATNDIKANQMVTVTYDGTNFQLQSIVSSFLGLFASGTTTKNLADANTTQNIPHGLGVAPLQFIMFANSATSISSLTLALSGGSMSIGSTGGNQPSQDFLIETSNNVSQRGVVTVDATNIIITWTKSGAPTGTSSILWQAIA